MDNLGGFKNGAGQTDAVMQTIQVPLTGSQSGQPPGAIYGAVGSYPMSGTQGGYIYVRPAKFLELQEAKSLLSFPEYLLIYPLAGGCGQNTCI